MLAMGLTMLAFTQRAAALVNPPTPVMIYDSSNHYIGGCGLTDTTTWTMDNDAYVNSFQIWYSWNAGETNVQFDIKKDGAEFASGSLTRSSCDPYQHQWCNGDYASNRMFPKGTYTATVSSPRQCKDNTGDGVIRLYGPPTKPVNEKATTTTQKKTSPTTTSHKPAAGGSAKGSPCACIPLLTLIIAASTSALIKAA